jgi:hypothetical protein
METLGLAARRDCERFTRSANDPAISGVFARHSQKPTSPIADPMNENEARGVVQALLERWIASLSEQQQIEIAQDGAVTSHPKRPPR